MDTKTIIVIVFCLIIILILLYYFYNNKSSDIKTEWKNNGFCKISNYLKTDLENIKSHIKFVENEYPNLINTFFNNNIVKNINRKTMELIRDIDNQPYPFNEYKRNKYIGKLTPYHSISKIDAEGGQYYNYKTDEELFHRDVVLYDKSSEKNNFIIFINNFVNKLRKEYPEIVTNDLDLYHVMCFYIYPMGDKQEIHRDTFYFYNEEKNGEDNIELNTLQIFIPLHDTSIEQGATIFYKRNMIDYDFLKNNDSNVKINENIINNPKITTMLNNAKIQEEMKEGDIIFMDKDVYHQGGENKTNTIRKTLLIQLA